ncbi:hypothetical protein QRD86_00445 (plasmid) [Bacillus halotolerans]|uniref:hypothetical protein n=1 Tax=Bacillus halotolerans TaxID=260554 RepID=UPI00256FCEF6|nr:hypothetical protein [Bacillus halotolerans]WJE41154.1 hypothetical protein QRD86_00445 [Bacillus halotolerans]
MGALTQDEINMNLFSEVKRLKKEISNYEKLLLKIKDAYENDEESKLDELLYGLFSNEPDTEESY